MPIGKCAKQNVIVFSTISRDELHIITGRVELAKSSSTWPLSCCEIPGIKTGDERFTAVIRPNLC